MQLLDVLKDIDYRLIAGDPEKEIASIEYDSRKVSEGSLFVCVIGFNSDGHSFAMGAINNGASAIVVDSARSVYPDEELKAIASRYGISVVETADTHKYLADLSANFYGHPEKKLSVFGITGTKGKTTTAFMLREILE